MKKYYLYIKTILYLLILAIVLGFSSKRNAMRAVLKPVISFSNEDNLFLTHKMVDNLLRQNDHHVVNQPKSLINLQELEDKVELHPMVSSAEVSLDVMGRLEVNVKQRKPLARMFNIDSTFYLDSKGLKMPLSGNYSARVLIVDNKNDFIQSKEIFPLIQKIHADEFLNQLIVSIKKDKEGYWFLTRYKQQKVLFGSLNKTHQKLKKLKVFYSYLAKDNLSKTFKKIDLQYNNQVVCSK